MKIESDNIELLDEFYGLLVRENVQVERETKKIDNAQGDVTLYLLFLQTSLQAIDVFINTLSYFNQRHKNNNNHYIYVELENGKTIEIKNLSESELANKLKIIKENFEQIKSINIG